VKMSREEVRRWNEPIPTSSANMKDEIESALKDSNFVLTMRPIQGAIETIVKLKKKGCRIVILTHRDPIVREATIAWLDRNGIPHDDFYNTKETGKGVVYTDLLVDDYPPNFEQYVHGGKAILFQQPWNQDFAKQEAPTKNIHVAKSWPEVYAAVNKHWRQTKGLKT
jgi:5'(3')-deoxyribonucleotidase